MIIALSMHVHVRPLKFNAQMNDAICDRCCYLTCEKNDLETKGGKKVSIKSEFILLIHSLHIRSKTCSGSSPVIVKQYGVLPHLFRNSMYSVCLMSPVLIMIVWKHCRSMAHSFTFVKAGDKKKRQHTSIFMKDNLYPQGIRIPQQYVHFVQITSRQSSRFMLGTFTGWR